MNKDNIKGALGTFKKKIDGAMKGKNIAEDTKSAVYDMLKDMGGDYSKGKKDKKDKKKDKKDKKDK